MSDAGGNGRPGGPPPEGAAHAYGADEARAYVPPQAIKQKAKPTSDGGAKVQIREGVDPRRMKTELRPGYDGGTLPMQPIPPEVHAHQAGRAQHTPPQGIPAAAGALPFRPAEAGGTPPMPVAVPPGYAAAEPPPVGAPPQPVQPPPVVPAQPPYADPSYGGAGIAPAAAPAPVAAPAPAAPVATGPRPKRPPAQLTSPGVLSGPQGAPRTVLQALGLIAGDPVPGGQYAQGAPHAPAANGYPPAPQGGYPQAQVPAAPPAAAPAHAPQAPAPAMAAAPNGQVAPGSDPTSASGPSAGPSTGVSAGPPPGEHPLASTNSPWSQEQKVAADLLPSASVLAPPEAEAPPPPPPVEPETATHSRTAMTIGLAVAALALIAAVVYFTVAESERSDDPANVKVGSEQREYGEEPLPEPTQTAAPKVAPKPPPPRPVPKAPPKPKPPEDIYENIE